MALALEESNAKLAEVNAALLAERERADTLEAALRTVVNAASGALGETRF